MSDAVLGALILVPLVIVIYVVARLVTAVADVWHAHLAAVNTPSQYYVAVAYDARERKLTYTDDVSPRRVPTRAQFAHHLDVVARMVEINALANRAAA